LGATLADHLRKYRSKTGLEFAIRTMDLVSLPKQEDLEHFQGSILDMTDLSEAFRGCDTVVHLAALLGVRNTEFRRLACLNINIQGTVAVLEACAKERIKRIIFASSSEVYGESSENPITESAPLNPKSIYAVTKLAGEEYVRTYSERYGMDYTIFRFFNAYGSLQVAQFVISRFVQAVIEDRPPLLIGDGSQMRCFCHGRDISDGIIRALFTNKANGETINLGNNQEPITMKELANRVIRISGKTHLQPQIATSTEADRQPERDIYCRVPSIEKAKKLLGFKPAVSLDDGIRSVLEEGGIKQFWQGRNQI